MTLNKVGQTVLNTVTGSSPVTGGNAKTLFTSASNLLGTIVRNKVETRIASQAQGYTSRRGIVSDATLNKLKEKIPGKVTIKETTPYQESNHCMLQATNILEEQMRRSNATRVPAQSEDKGLVATLGALWKRAFHGTLERRNFADGKDLLDIYKDKGSFSLRGPGLGEGYRDHVLAVFAVIDNVQTKNGPKTVLCALDCNDKGDDPETTAAWELADQLDKMHISELTHDEANQAGAEKRRIRFMDMDKLVQHMQKFGVHYLQSGLKVAAPEASYPRENNNTRLTPGEEADLRKILEQLYDSNDPDEPGIEKFENVDYSKLKTPPLPIDYRTEFIP